MKRFEYADELIKDKEILVAVASMVIGVALLTLPKGLTNDTIAADAWVSLLIGGVIAIILAWMVAKIASQYPGQTFVVYAAKIVSKPVAIGFTLIHSLIAMNITAFQIREIADISKHYLFERTPFEVVALCFFLVVIYAVSGSRVGLLRLNMLFLPIILFVLFVVITIALGWFDPGNLLPVFKTDFMGYIKATKTSAVAYIGFGILWFYIALMKQPKNAPKMAALGMLIPTFAYLLVFIICIGVFGNSVTSNLMFPTIELAKEVEIPGEIFERFESIFFVIWIMAIFNTTAMAFDISVLAITSAFKKATHLWVIFVLAPIIYFIAMLPKSDEEVGTYGTIVGYVGGGYTLFIVIVLYTVAKVRGGKK